MVADGMLTRKRYREVPPRVDYELTERARELMPVLGELARWGYEWAWSLPRSTESVDLGAIFRLAPGLIGSSEVAGTVEFSVTADNETEGASYTFTLGRDGVTIEERPADEPDARVSGDRLAWINAFGPGRDRDRLSISGNASLASMLLDGLTAEIEARAAVVRAA
jgi:hypothetical protein